MFLELSKYGTAVAEVFYSDADGRTTLTRLSDEASQEVLDALVAEAARRLPPGP
ncbi:MAG: hypothetical protein J0I28_05710 [Caulobacterales bacterium]|nr:hypothetical protein [Caulobacterales bacterium]